MSLRLVGLLLLSWFILPSLAPADEPLSRAVGAVLDRAEFRGAHWGLLVVDLDGGDTLYERNADKMFAPASVTKLFSVAAALDTLGHDYRFETPVYATGEIDKQGRLEGDLILVASGDLSFGGRTDRQGRLAFRNVDHTYASPVTPAELTDTNPLAGIEDLVNQIAEAGIKHVRGEVMVDDRLFEPAQSTGSGPSRLTPIVVNDNLIDLVVIPAADPGQPARVEWRPHGSWFTIDSQVDTVAKDGPVSLFVRAFPSGFVVRGTVPVGRPRVVVSEVDNAALTARALFIDALRRKGIKVNASALGPLAPLELPDREDYSSLKRVAVHVSPPFAESAKVILKVSHNLNASTLPLLVATMHGQRTLAQGLRWQHEFLVRAGVDVGSISFGGGAGGDRADYVTPRATVQLLRHMADREDFEVYRDALPVLGVDGTLATAVDARSPAKGKIRAKTGTLAWGNTLNSQMLLQSKALAGYAETAKGNHVAFAIFVNLVPLKKGDEATRIGRVLGELCEILHREL